MELYVQLRWCAVSLLQLCFLNIVISTQNSRNVYVATSNLTVITTNNETTVSSPLEGDIAVVRPCEVNENCIGKINTTSLGSWFCNETTQQCQLHCPAGYHHRNASCQKPRKRNVYTTLVVRESTSLKIYDTSVRIGSSCDYFSHSCSLINAVCSNGRCVCKYPNPVADFDNNQCLKYVYEEGGQCKFPGHCYKRKCKNNTCQNSNDITAQAEAFMLGFGIFVIILMLFVSILGCIGRRRFLDRRRRRARNESTPYTSSTLELMAEFRQPPPSYAEVFMVGRNQVITKPPSYDEAVEQGDAAGWSSAALEVPSNAEADRAQANVPSIGSTLVMGEGSSESPNVERLRSELRRYPRDNQITVRQEVPELVESNV